MRKALRCWALLCALLASLAFFLAHAEPGRRATSMPAWSRGAFTHGAHRGSTRTDPAVASAAGSQVLQ